MRRRCMCVWEGGEGGTRVNSLCMDEQVLEKEPVGLGEMGGGGGLGRWG